MAQIPGIDIDEKKVISSTGGLELGAVPKNLVVVGGGYIGLELGSVWRRLGSEVLVVEFLDRITPGMDAEVSKNFQRILKKQGMDFKLGHKVTGIETKGKGCKVSIEPAKGGDAETIDCDVVLVSIGRVPYTEGLGLEDVGVRTGQSRPRYHRCAFQDQCRRHLRHRRRHRRSDAGTQGRGRGRRGCRDPGRPKGARQL